MSTSNKHQSKNVIHALKLLQSIRGKQLSMQERKEAVCQLAEYLMNLSNEQKTTEETQSYIFLSNTLQSLRSKAFIMKLADVCFRSKSNAKIANQIHHLIYQYGIPTTLGIKNRIKLYLFKTFSHFLPALFVSTLFKHLRQYLTHFVLPAEKINKYIQQKKSKGFHLCISHIGEITTGEKDAENKLQIYLNDLANPLIHSISIKISALMSTITPENFDHCQKILTKRLKKIYRKANEMSIDLPNEKKQAKFITIDTETYEMLNLTVAVFQKILDDKEFFDVSSAITLQAYFPDSFALLKKLTIWAQDRVKKGGGKIKISLVKGAYLAKEQVNASKNNWEQSAYLSKKETDANYKKMLLFSLKKEYANSISIGVATQNIFDICFALVLQAENELENEIFFEMLHGSMPHIQKAVKLLINQQITLYCAIAFSYEFSQAISFVTRRIDELTNSENFQYQILHLIPGTEKWEKICSDFSQSIDEIDALDDLPRRKQNRLSPAEKTVSYLSFANEPSTDFSLQDNRLWAKKLIQKWKKHKSDDIPNVINGKEIHSNEKAEGFDPSNPFDSFYHYSLANSQDIEKAITCAKNQEKKWQNIPIDEKRHLINSIAQIFRKKRDTFIGILMKDIGKTLCEADAEISTAIDNIEYYCTRISKTFSRIDVEWKSNGTFVVVSARSFPCLGPITHIIAALITGNCVIFKPAPEAVLCGYYLAKVMWESGISKQILQFIYTTDEILENHLIKDPRISSVILSGKAQTAKKIMQLHPGLDLTAIANGQNSMIITPFADRDLAIKDLVHSAFGFSGQKYASTSFAILDAELYENPFFRKKLRDAAASLNVGSVWDVKNSVGPLLQKPDDILLKEMTTLEQNEKWLLKPKQDPNNPHLWSPGIKMGITQKSSFFKNPTLGPILGLMRSNNLSSAISIANNTPYGLTAGLHSLDDREHHIWLSKIQVGNCYINRQMSDAMVRREPFGGCKNSSFGHGYKAGGPNFLEGCMVPSQKYLPKEKQPVNAFVNKLSPLLEKIDLSAEELGYWYASIANYAYWWKRMQHYRDPSKVIGQDNLFGYVPRKNIILRIQAASDPLDSLRICAAALTCSSSLEISFDSKDFNWNGLSYALKVSDEDEKTFIERINSGQIKRIRLSSPAPSIYKEAAADNDCYIIDQPVLANGRYELLHYLREVTISHEYHRYGNLGARENELRKPNY